MYCVYLQTIIEYRVVAEAGNFRSMNQSSCTLYELQSGMLQRTNATKKSFYQ